MMQRFHSSSVYAIILLLAYCHSSSSSDLDIHCDPAEGEALLSIGGLECSLADSPYCCLTYAVICNETTGHIISVNLSQCVDTASISPKSSFFDLRYLQTLSISNLNLDSSIPDGIGKLSELQTLEIDGFGGSIPSAIGNLSKLQSLIIVNGSSSGTGTIPDSFGNLHNLQVMHLENVGLTGDVPSFVRNLTQLRTIDLSRNTLSGKLPSFLFEDLNPNEIYLQGNNLEGSLPSTVPLDSALNYLDLSDNNLTGTVPPWVSQLTVLRLSDNEFSGPIPTVAKQQLPSYYYYAKTFDLSGNRLEGIPNSLFAIDSLMILNLSRNTFSGFLDFRMFKNATSLYILDMSGNPGLSVLQTEGLSSSILSSLRELYLDHCNLTLIPDFLGVLGLETISLRNNRISGPISFNKWGTSLKNFDASFNNLESFLTEIPDSSQLEKITLSNNRISGPISFNKSGTSLEYFDASFNNIEGVLTEIPDSLTFLYLSHNHLTGDVPISNGNLENLDLSFNNFNGIRTPDGGMYSRLDSINLGNNNITGSMPTLQGSPGLSTILLNGNGFTNLHRSLANLTDLKCLDIGNNNITDVFPYWLGDLPDLRVLVISSNNFYGNIAETQSTNPFPFPSLLVLDASHNHFSGLIPVEYFLNYNYFTTWNWMFKDTEISIDDAVSVMYKGSKTFLSEIVETERENFTSIDLSYNLFSGSIPREIGSMRKLMNLNLNNNNLSGEIPSFQNSTSIRSLDLSSNNLAGEIPKELLNLTKLDYLNLSYNQLQGRIPEGKIFSNASYVGNRGLCGIPLSNVC